MPASIGTAPTGRIELQWWHALTVVNAPTFSLRLLSQNRRLTKLTIDGHIGPMEEPLSATISIAQAKARFAALVVRAEAGEKIVVTRNGRPVADDLSLPEDVIRDFEPTG